MIRKRIAKGALEFGLGTGISRILGLAREIILAHLFGAGIAMDAFRVAFRIPNLLRDLLAEGTLTPAFLPVFSDYHIHEGRKRALELVSFLLGVMLIITGAIAVIGILFAPLWVRIVSFGFTQYPDKLALTIKLTRIMFPFLIFISLSALVMGVLNFFKHFFTTGVASCWFNIAIIVLGLTLAPKFGIASIAIGALLGGILQLVFQLPLLKKEGYLTSPRFKLTPDVKRVLLLMTPIAIGYGGSKINVVINTLIASFLGHGSISWLSYAFRLMWVPVGVIGVALANVALPFASRELSTNNREEFKQTINTSLLYGLLLAIPVSVLLWYFAQPICKILYQRGNFTIADTLATSQALKFYSIGIIGLVCTKIFATGFFALKDTKTPMKVSFVTIGVNAICALTFVFVLKLSFKGIALAASVANLANALILGVLFKIRIKWNQNL